MRPLFLLLPLLAACESEPLSSDYAGVCQLPDGIQAELTVRELEPLPDGAELTISGNWLARQAVADVERFDTGEAVEGVSVVIARCEDENGCDNQGDPYDYLATLFDINVSDGGMPGEIILKGSEDEEGRYTGVCAWGGVSLGLGTFDIVPI